MSSSTWFRWMCPRRPPERSSSAPGHAEQKTARCRVGETLIEPKCNYSLQFKGNTLVQINPSLEPGPLETAPPIGNRRWLYELSPEKYRTT